jgi:hypothetical protein
VRTNLVTEKQENVNSGYIACIILTNILKPICIFERHRAKRPSCPVLLAQKKRKFMFTNKSILSHIQQHVPQYWHGL